MKPLDETGFDDELRRKFDGFEETPAPASWARLTQRLPPPASPAPGGGPGRPFGAGVALGILLTAATLTFWPAGNSSTTTNGGGPVAARPAAAGVAQQQQGPAAALSAQRVETGAPVRPALRLGGRNHTLIAAETVRPVRAAAQASVAISGTPAPGVTLLIPARSTPAVAAIAPQKAEEVVQLRARVVAQQAEITSLHRMVDSLKAALPELPGLPVSLLEALPDSLPAVVVAATGAPAAESRPLLSELPRWSALLALETTGSWGTLPSVDPTTTQERTLNSMSRGVHLQRRVGDRWLVRVGLGDTRVQTYLRYAADRTRQTTKCDTVTTIDEEISRTIDTTFIIHLDSVARLEPRLNGSGQVAGYDTSWVSTNDTTYQVIVANDTLRRQSQVVTTHVLTERQRREQQLRPEYRFWTVPVAVRYEIVRGNRWRLGLMAGANVSFFRGGSRPVWNGDQYELRRVGPRDGPYRPISLQLSGGLEAEYRLTPRLSAVLTPSVRWWMLNPVRTGAMPRNWLPAAQLGLSYGF